MKNLDKRQIYLDNAASTPIRDEVFQEMIPFLTNNFGNPSSLHFLGRESKKAIKNARRQICDLIGCSLSEIVFTSGGTEANNLAIKGIAGLVRDNMKNEKNIITTEIEHDAILECMRDLQELGFKITYLPVSKDGLVSIDKLNDAISKSTILVSIMMANNEIGTIQNIKELVKITKDKNSKILFHSDAVQGIGKIPINVREIGIDTMSISSHKINGPKGIGALFLKNGVKIKPILHGGGQENEIRSGTENVAGIVGFGKACEIARENLLKNIDRLYFLRDYLIEKVSREINNSKLNGSLKYRLPNNINFTFTGINGEDLVMKLDENNICVSTGSACSTNRHKPSHVLKAIGCSYEEITGSLRISIGLQNSIEELDYTVNTLKRVIPELLENSPFNSKYKKIVHTH